MALLKVLFADDEIPDEETLEEELKKPIHFKKYSLWKLKKTLDDISKLTVANKYENAIKLAKDKELKFDIAIIDLHWNDYKENEDAGFEICEALDETSQPFKIVYSSRLNENPNLRKKIIDLNALPLHKNYEITNEKQIERSCEQLKSAVIFMEMLRSQKSKSIPENYNLIIYGDVSGQVALGTQIKQTLSTSDKKELLDSLVEFQKEIAKLNIPKDNLSIVNSDVNAAIKEAEKKNPDISKIKSRFEWALDRIKEAGKSVKVISELYEPAKKVAKLVGIGLSVL